MTESKSPTILITGATGNIGKELIKELSVQKFPFRAMVRSSKSAEAVATLEGAEAVIGDFNDAKSIADAVQGIDQAFLLTNSSGGTRRGKTPANRPVHLINLHAITRRHFLIMKLILSACGPIA